MQDLFIDEVNKRLIFAALLIVAGVIFVIKRGLVSAVEKNVALRAIERIKRKPSYAQEVASELDIPFGVKESFPLLHFEKLKEFLKSQTMIGEYQILFVAEASSSEFLVFTLTQFREFDVGITGSGTDVDKEVYQTFLLSHDYKEQRLNVQSTIHTKSTEKFQREGFFKALFEGA